VQDGSVGMGAAECTAKEEGLSRVPITDTSIIDIACYRCAMLPISIASDLPLSTRSR
jgi:hypothetical protein